MGQEDDILETTLDTGLEVSVDPNQEISAVLDDLEALLKSGEVVGALTSRGVNASIALCAAAGLRAYLAGNKAEAAEELATAAEEIRGRAAAGYDGGSSPRGPGGPRA